MKYFKQILLFVCFGLVTTMLGAQPSVIDNIFQVHEKYNPSVFITPKQVGQSVTIHVSSQNDLNNLNTNIRKYIKTGVKIIKVQISSGVYYYDRLPVYLYNIDAKDVSIDIIGNNTIMVAGGNDYPDGSVIEQPVRANVYLDKGFNLIDLYGDVVQSEDEVEVLNKSKKECRLAVNVPLQYMPGMKVQISEWFHSPIYEVTKIADGHIYFIAHDLKYDNSKKCYNVQYDNKIGQINPRFRIIDPQRVKNHPAGIHECEVSLFLTLYRVKLKSFTLSGISFYGCAQGKNALCYFREVESDGISISNCRFESMNQRVVKLKQVPNFIFYDNVVANSYYGALYSDIDCPRTIVKGNHFYRTENSWTNTSCVTCYGTDFLIVNNRFEDIGYASIVSGYHKNWGEKMVCSGVIENNEIFFGEEYCTNSDKYTLMDSGAIYLGTQNDKVIVRYNYIHNYRGVNSNRAIYCDEGAMNVKIYGNIISGVTNAHSILSWRATNVNKKFPQSNDGIDVFYNVIWGSYKFDERPNSSCVHGKNLILYAEGEKTPENILKNFAYQEKDLVFSGVSSENGKMIIPSEAMKELKKFPTYQKMKHWLE